MSENALDEHLRRGEHREQPELLMPHTVLARTAADLAAKYEGGVSPDGRTLCLRVLHRVTAYLPGAYASDDLGGPVRG